MDCRSLSAKETVIVSAAHEQREQRLPSIKFLFQLVDHHHSHSHPYHHHLVSHDYSHNTLPPIRITETDDQPQKLVINEPKYIYFPKNSDDHWKTTEILKYQQKPMVPHKRKQVKRACKNCQKACKGCGESRPCPRCIMHGLTKTCEDAPRKSDLKRLISQNNPTLNFFQTHKQQNLRV